MESTQEKEKGKTKDHMEKECGDRVKRLTWGEAESLAKDRSAWRLRVAVLSNRREMDK